MKIKFYSNELETIIEAEVIEKRKNTWKLLVPRRECMKKKFVVGKEYLGKDISKIELRKKIFDKGLFFDWINGKERYYTKKEGWVLVKVILEPKIIIKRINQLEIS